ELDALSELEPPGRLPFELPLGRQRRVELAIRVPAREVVENVERDADVLGRRAEMGIEPRDVAPLSGDELFLLSRLRPHRARSDLRHAPRDSESCRALEQFASSDVHRILDSIIRIELTSARRLAACGALPPPRSRSDHGARCARSRRAC